MSHGSVWPVTLPGVSLGLPHAQYENWTLQVLPHPLGRLRSVPRSSDLVTWAVLFFREAPPATTHLSEEDMCMVRGMPCMATLESGHRLMPLVPTPFPLGEEDTFEHASTS